MTQNSNQPVNVSVNGHRPAGGLSRREAMQWVLGAVAASALPTAATDALAQSAHGLVGGPVAAAPPGAAAAQATEAKAAAGYGVDPVLTKGYKPGAFWPLTFSDAQRKTATALADTIIPKDALGPAASEVGVIEMIDEWVSAPYPQQQADRPVVIDGLVWIDAESAKRFGKPFAEVSAEQKHAICDDICYAATAKPAFKKGAQFFARFRTICASAYYATPEGWKAIGYVGNVALPSFDGPPPEVLEKLGVTQTVK